jgi:hypothetical protein
MGNRFFCRFVLSVILFVCISPTVLYANVQNGDFSAGLSGWTIEYGTVVDGGGYVLFEEDALSLSSTLSQVFNLPIGSQILSFEMVMSSQLGGDYDPFAWPDVFTASLLDPVTLDPLVFNPGYTEFYYLDNLGNEVTVASVTGNKVMLDVAALAGQDVFLSFDLWGSDDGMLTSVNLDNVKVTVIPVPGALLLGLIGTGAVGLWRKFRKCA